MASTIEIIGIRAIMGPVNLDQDGEKFYLDEEQENLWASTANMSRTTIATTFRGVIAAKWPQDEEYDEFSIPATAVAQPTTVSRHGRVRKITRKAQGLAAIKNSSSGRRGGIRGGGRGRGRADGKGRGRNNSGEDVDFDDEEADRATEMDDGNDE